MKYFCNAAYFKKRYGQSCPFCGKETNSREHLVDECPKFEDEASCFVGYLIEKGQYLKGDKLSTMIDRIYFKPIQDKPLRKEVMNELMHFVTMLFKDREALGEGRSQLEEQDEQADDDQPEENPIAIG